MALKQYDNQDPPTDATKVPKPPYGYTHWLYYVLNGDERPCSREVISYCRAELDALIARAAAAPDEGAIQKATVERAIESIDPAKGYSSQPEHIKVLEWAVAKIRREFGIEVTT